MSGLKKILGLKFSLNLGLSDELKSAFPDLNVVQRPEINSSTEIINPYWLAGFTSGEGCFYVKIKKSLPSPNGGKARYICRTATASG